MVKPHVEYFRTNLNKIKNHTCQMKLKERCPNEIRFQYILITKSNRKLEIYYICKEHRREFYKTIEDINKMYYLGSWD